MEVWSVRVPPSWRGPVKVCGNVLAPGERIEIPQESALLALARGLEVYGPDGKRIGART